MSGQLVGLVAHPEKRGAPELVAALRREFLARGTSLFVERKSAALIGEPSSLELSDLGRECDLVMVLGGDGTILNTIHALGSRLPPIFGVNLGTLGFLTCLGSSDYRHAVERVISGNYLLSERTLLSIEVLSAGQVTPASGAESAASSHQPATAPLFALNDAVVSRGALSRLIHLETRVDGVLLTEYNADGLIIATPTGSTAYSLSAGGPLLAPDSGVFVVTPICPHALANRSVIISDQSKVDVRLRQERGEVFLTIDGQQQIALQVGDTVRIRRAEQRLPLVVLPDLPFFELTRRKFRWGGGGL